MPLEVTLGFWSNMCSRKDTWLVVGMIPLLSVALSNKMIWTYPCPPLGFPIWAVHRLDPESSFLLIPGRKVEEVDLSLITDCLSVASYDAAVVTFVFRSFIWGHFLRHFNQWYLFVYNAPRPCSWGTSPPLSPLEPFYVAFRLGAGVAARELRLGLTKIFLQTKSAWQRYRGSHWLTADRWPTLANQSNSSFLDSARASIGEGKGQVACGLWRRTNLSTSVQSIFAIMSW